MRVSSMPPFLPVPPQAVSMPAPPPEPVRFLPFSAQAFHEARTRHVPVFLVIAEQPPELSDVSLSMQIAERTVPVHLYPGVRRDVELLCQRAGALFSAKVRFPSVRCCLRIRARFSPRRFRRRAFRSMRRGCMSGSLRRTGVFPKTCPR